jgi:hypothetical protein
MTPFITERLKKGGLSVGMVVNEAIEHGDYKVDFQPLDANVFQDAQEIQALEQRIPNFSKMSPALQRRLGQQLDSGQGFPLNTESSNITSRYQTPASGSVGSSGLNADFRSLGALTHYHPGNDIDGNHGGPNSHGDWLFKDTATAHYVFDYVTQQKVDGKKIVLTEMGGRTSVSRGHSPDGGHYDKLKFDVPWDQFGSGPITSEDERKYNEVVSHIYNALKYKQQGIPVKQAIGGQQQTQKSTKSRDQMLAETVAEHRANPTEKNWFMVRDLMSSPQFGGAE